jgi:YgiT-type zinc finger domain-containing protein
MRCQRCDQRDRRPVRRAKLAERDAKVTLVLDVPMQECPACGERRQDWDISRRLEELLTAMLTGVEVATRHFDATYVPAA